jgi:hypothetical protein
MVAVVVSFGATACGKETIRLPEGRPGSMNVGGAVRARSSHYQLIGTLSPTGGSHAASGIQLHDGVFVNQNK